MNVRELIEVVRDSRIALLVCLAAGAMVGLIFGSLQPQVYRSTAVGYVVVEGGDATATTADNNEFSRHLALSLAALADTETVLDSISDDLDLDESTAAVSQRVTVVVEQHTSVISVSTTAETGAAAKTLANAVLRELTELIPEVAPKPKVSDPTEISLVVAQQPSTPSAPETPSLASFVVLGGLVGITGAAIVALSRAVLSAATRNA